MAGRSRRCSSARRRLPFSPLPGMRVTGCPARRRSPRRRARLSRRLGGGPRRRLPRARASPRRGVMPRGATGSAWATTPSGGRSPSVAAAWRRWRASSLRNVGTPGTASWRGRGIWTSRERRGDVCCREADGWRYALSWRGTVGKGAPFIRGAWTRTRRRPTWAPKGLRGPVDGRVSRGARGVCLDARRARPALASRWGRKPRRPGDEGGVTWGGAGSRCPAQGRSELLTWPAKKKGRAR